MTVQTTVTAASGGLHHPIACPLSKGLWFDGFSGY
jgi:hypothetical protein